MGGLNLGGGDVDFESAVEFQPCGNSPGAVGGLSLI